LVTFRREVSFNIISTADYLPSNPYLLKVNMWSLLSRRCIPWSSSSKARLDVWEIWTSTAIKYRWFFSNLLCFLF